MVSLGAKIVFAALLALSLFFGLMAVYARDIRRDRSTTRVFAALGALAMMGAVVVGWRAL